MLGRGDDECGFVGLERDDDGRKVRKSPKVLAGIAAVVGVATVVARKRGNGTGTKECIVRCREGHLFSTIWVPGASLKAIRLGPARLQRCPVGRHWSVVTPVQEAELSDEDRRAALEIHDLGIP